MPAAAYIRSMRLAKVSSTGTPQPTVSESPSIAMLGDSLTVGWGVPVDDTFAKRIERMYAAAGIDAEVINFGVGNYNTVQEVQAFLAQGYRYRPDVVVLNYFVNDAELQTPASAP